MLAFMPSASTYGFVSRAIGETTSHSLAVIVFCTVLSSFFLFLALISKLNDSSRINNARDNDLYANLISPREYKSGESLLKDLGTDIND